MFYLRHLLLMAQRLILLPHSDNSPETPFQFPHVPEYLCRDLNKSIANLLPVPAELPV